MNFAAKTVANSMMSKAKEAVTPNKGPKINWEDFNYPPLIKLIHFDLSEIEETKVTVVRFLWLSHLLIFAYSIINILNNIVCVAQGEKGVRILYAFMFFFTFNPIQGFIFYRGYRGFVSDAFLLQLYKWVQILLILCWVVFAIVKFLGFNGFIAVSYFFNNGLMFEGVLAIIESSLLMIVAGLSTFALVKIWSSS